MKKIAILMFIISSLIFISCSEDGGGDTETGYVDPGSWTGKDVNPAKSYEFTHPTPNESCGPNAQCNAIIYQNTLDGIDYVGIAVNDKHVVLPEESDFSLKIYWQGSTLNNVGPAPTNYTINDYTIKVVKGPTEYTTTTNPLNIEITDNEDGSYTIKFITNEIDLTGFKINIDDKITAFKYP